MAVNIDMDMIVVSYLQANDINVVVYRDDDDKVCQDIDTGEILVKSPRSGFNTAFTVWRKSFGGKLVDFHKWCDEKGFLPF